MRSNATQQDTVETVKSSEEERKMEEKKIAKGKGRSCITVD